MPTTTPGKRFGLLEYALATFGLYSLASGSLRGEVLELFWGILILCGLGLLTLVRRKDWASHWRELDSQSRAGQPGDQRSEPPATD